ncbi:MAG: hypothetical protein HYR88_03680 [Verrucomicrobia bacterium]|nr:hypothetical protein [Verrucomicrobiota bacterium]
MKLLNFAVDKTGYPANQPRTGFLIVTGQSSGSDTQTQTLDVAGGFGNFTFRPADADKVALVASHPMLDLLQASDLTDLHASAHVSFLSWPAGFYPFALCVDFLYPAVPPASFYAPPFRSLEQDSKNGFTAPWILVRGAQRQLMPQAYTQAKQPGQTCTITAVFQTLAQSPAPITGQRIGFAITSGPNQGRTGTFTPTTRLTDAQGKVSFAYTPIANPVGIDHITLFLDNNNDNVWQPSLGEGSVEAIVSWGTPTVSISAVDANASETGPDPAVFRITRTGGSTAQPLTVALTFRDAANAQSTGAPVPSEDDYIVSAVAGANVQVDTSKHATVTILAGQASLDITVTPIDDTLAEGPERIECSIRPGLTYSTDPNFIAVATIQDNDTPTVSVTALDSTASEDPAAADTGVFLFQRTGGTAASLTVFYTLPLGPGRAIYGGDYLLDPPAQGSVTFGTGETDFQLTLTAVVDSRNEGPETVRLDLVPPPSMDTPFYTLGGSSTATITIVDNPGNTLPIPNSYTIVNLGTINPNTNQAPINPTSRGFGINASGMVVGDYTPPTYLGTGTHSFRYYNGGLSDLTSYTLGASATAYAFGINSAGATVGTYYNTALGLYSAIRWTDALNATMLVPLPGSLGNQQANAISDNTTGEWIAGWGVNAQGKYRAVVWENGFTDDLGTLPGTDGLLQSYALGVNNHPFGHRVTGRSVYRDDSPITHAFLTQAQYFAIYPGDDLGTLWGSDAVNSEGTSVNDLNEVVGSSMTASVQTHAFIKAPDSGKHLGFVDLGVLPGDTYSRALSIANNGLIVGVSRTPGYIERAVIWYNNGQIANLITKVSNPGSWTLSTAASVNSSGSICGTGYLNGIQRAFLLIPN